MTMDPGIGSAGHAKGMVFNDKIVADYYGYIAENAGCNHKREVSKAALKAGDVSNELLES